jgi:hypothetical protein
MLWVPEKYMGGTVNGSTFFYIVLKVGHDLRCPILENTLLKIFLKFSESSHGAMTP